MNYVLLTVYESMGFHTAIIGVPEKCEYISEAGNLAYCDWCKKHNRQPGRGTSYDYKFLGTHVEFINCAEG